ncbi:MAG TPA: lipid-A-disaccharide synthase [Candidatus Obscuribacterales bacterium]
MTQVPHADPAPLHILISTGEVSGDLQGSYLVQALHRQAQTAGQRVRLSAVGGPRMAAAGVELLWDTTGISSVGIFEALPYLLPVWRLQRRLQRFLQQESVDLVVFLDYMGPNLGLGKTLRQRYPGLLTAYYIAPQQWVWTFSEQDTRSLVDISDHMVAIFPQEADYYQRYGAQVNYFGHPLVDRLQLAPTRATARQQLGIAAEATVVTLLPASRRQEVKYILPLMLAVAAQIRAALPGTEFLLPVSTPQLRSAIEAAIARGPIQPRLVEGESLTAIAAADLVLNKSGTANLEVALMDVPQVVIYRLNPLTARIGYYLLNLRVEFVSPANLFLNRGIVPEFIQWEATVPRVTAASLQLLTEAKPRQAMLQGYADLRTAMGAPGVCDRVAAYLIDLARRGAATD